MAEVEASHGNLNDWKEYQTMVRRFQEIRFVPERDYYQATNEETWEAYQALITIVESQSRIRVPREVLCRVADEVLWVLKSRIFFTPSGKKAEIEKLLDPIPYFIFNQLVATADLITDYQSRVEIATEKDFYQPRSEETWAAYKALLDLINAQFGYEQPAVVQCVLAHEVLVTLKNGSTSDYDKREMISNTLNAISDHSFAALVSIGKHITDFNSNGGYELGGSDGYMNDPAKEPVRAGFHYDFTVDEGMEFQYEFDVEGFQEPDEEVMGSKSDSDVSLVADSGSESESGTDEELLRMGFEKVRVSDSEDTDEWEMIAFDD